MEESKRTYRKGEEYIEVPPKPNDEGWKEVVGADDVTYLTRDFADQYDKWCRENPRCKCGEITNKGICPNCKRS